MDVSIWFTFVDHVGGLWLALNKGLSRIDVSIPFLQYGDKVGLEGNIETIVRYQGKIYAGTSQGIFAMDSQGFRRIQDSPRFCWDLLSTPTGLIAGTIRGVYLIQDNRAERIRDDVHSYALYQSRSNPAVQPAGKTYK